MMFTPEEVLASITVKPSSVGENVPRDYIKIGEGAACLKNAGLYAVPVRDNCALYLRVGVGMRAVNGQIVQRARIAHRAGLDIDVCNKAAAAAVIDGARPCSSDALHGKAQLKFLGFGIAQNYHTQGCLRCSRKFC